MLGAEHVPGRRERERGAPRGAVVGEEDVADVVDQRGHRQRVDRLGCDRFHFSPPLREDRRGRPPDRGPAARRPNGRQLS